MTSVADVIIDGLVRAGTPRFFAGSGDASVLIDAAQRRGLDVVQARSEMAACIMAAVTGALGGAPGAVVIAGDPTAVHEGLASAFAGRCPLIVVTGGVGDAVRSAMTAVTKATLQAGPGSAAHWIAHAGQLAMTEPWGPVHLDVPDGVARQSALPVATACRPAALPPPDPDALDAVARLLGESARPLLVVGRQCRSEDNAAWLRAFAEALPAPALVTPTARGALPDPHPLVIGTLGASARESELLGQADLIVAVGLDPLEVRPHAWPAQTPVAHLATVPPMGDGYRVTAAVVGEIGLIIEELAPRLRQRRLADWDVARLHALKQAMSQPPSADATGVTAYRVVETARGIAPAGAVAIFDADEALAAATRAWQAIAPGECMVAPLRGLGFALPAAIAVRLMRPDRRVIAFTTRRLLVIAAEELHTIAGLGLPIIVVVLDDGTPSCLALARQAGLPAVEVGGIPAFGETLGGLLARGGGAAVLETRPV
jgi:acetolactate synthase-1/2/3 large subunit